MSVLVSVEVVLGCGLGAGPQSVWSVQTGSSHWDCPTRKTDINQPANTVSN